MIMTFNSMDHISGVAMRTPVPLVRVQRGGVQMNCAHAIQWVSDEIIRPEFRARTQQLIIDGFQCL